MDPSARRKLLKVILIQVLVLLASAGVAVLGMSANVEAFTWAVLIPVLVGLGALVWRLARPGPNEGAGMTLVRFLGALLVSGVAWAMLFAVLMFLARLTLDDPYGLSLTSFFVALFLAPQVVCTAGLLVLFRMGPGQRQVF